MNINEISSGAMQQSSTVGNNVIPLTARINGSETPAGQAQLAGVKKYLFPDAQGRVHEEQLQYALLSSLIEQKNPAAGEKFQAMFNQLIGSGRQPLGFEDSSRLALIGLTKNGLLDRSAAEEIFGKSFFAAQLDQNTSALWDDRGGANDITIAVKPLEEALSSVGSTLAAIDRGELTIPPRSLDLAANNHPGLHTTTTSSSTGTKNASGFLWKPVSDSNGNLVVLLPSAYSGKIHSVGIYSALPADSTHLLETGRFSGNANGGRAHFRFTHPGAKYPDNSVVVAQLTNGRQIEFPIADSAKRIEI